MGVVRIKEAGDKVTLVQGRLVVGGLVVERLVVGVPFVDRGVVARVVDKVQVGALTVGVGLFEQFFGAEI